MSFVLNGKNYFLFFYFIGGPTSFLLKPNKYLMCAKSCRLWSSYSCVAGHSCIIKIESFSQFNTTPSRKQKSS